MRIAQLAPTYERVPPVAYGGTELVVHLVTEELVRRGHEVTLFASGDSVTGARLVAVTPRPYRRGAGATLAHPEHVHLLNARACFRAAAEGAFDIVHNHAGVEGLVLAETSTTPVLTTCHMAYVPETAPAWDAYPWFHNAPSAASAATFPARGRLAPIHHGIDVARRPFGARGEGYLLFLGRLAAVKGPEVAIEVARRSGRRLVLAGKIDPEDRPYAESAVLPAVDGDRIRFVGEAGPADKARLLAGADALLFPITWEEPFGLVIIEALAAGTPVVAFARASVPELIEDGLTGFVVPDADRMVEALDRLGEIDRAHCRRVAEERFSVERMVDRYEATYRAILSGAPPLWTPPWDDDRQRAAGSASGSAPGSASGSASGSAPGAASGSASGSAPGFAPGAAADAASGSASGSERVR